MNQKTNTAYLSGIEISDGLFSNENAVATKDYQGKTHPGFLKDQQ